MNDRRLTCRPRETSSDLQTAPGQVRAIPDDLLRQASRRLEFLALLGAMLWVLAPVGAHLAQRMMRPGDPAWLRFSVNDGLATLGLALSLLVYAYLRRADRRPAAVMNLALFYMVATAFVLGPLTHSGTVTSQARGIAPMITWIPAVILMTAALVPAPPRRMLGPS